MISRNQDNFIQLNSVTSMRLYLLRVELRGTENRININLDIQSKNIESSTGRRIPWEHSWDSLDKLHSHTVHGHRSAIAN